MHSHTDGHAFESNLGFGILPKDTSTCWLQVSRIKPPILWSEDDHPRVSTALVLLTVCLSKYEVWSTVWCIYTLSTLKSTLLCRAKYVHRSYQGHGAFSGLQKWTTSRKPNNCCVQNVWVGNCRQRCSTFKLHLTSEVAQKMVSRPQSALSCFGLEGEKK